MRLARRQRRNERPEVQLSPLIDCVFLLVIFFLVTSMFKKWEMQIPITLPDTSSSVAENVKEEAEIIGLDAIGEAYSGTASERGQIVYTVINDLPLFLGQLAEANGPEHPVLLSVDRDTPFKTVIKTLDLAQLQGLKNISVRTRDRKK